MDTAGVQTGLLPSLGHLGSFCMCFSKLRTRSHFNFSVTTLIVKDKCTTSTSHSHLLIKPHIGIGLFSSLLSGFSFYTFDTDQRNHLIMKYFAPALCALLASTARAEEHVSDAETGIDKPVFTVRHCNGSLLIWKIEANILTAYEPESSLPRTIYRRLGDTVEAFTCKEGGLEV